MNYFFITGTSKGIGRALAAELLTMQYNKVFGISRSLVLHHDHYVHFHLDLADTKAVSQFRFPDLTEPKGIYLINNSGSLGEVRHSGELDNEKIISTYNLNIISPAILINKFIEKFKKTDCNKVILNISSGAAKRPIDGWSTYGSSKAALDLLSQTVQAECELDQNGFRIFSVAPGVVDTAMQDQIRSSSIKDFSSVQNFINFKEEGELQHPEVVARKIVYFMENCHKYNQVILSLNNAS
ncbi:MAG: SDR family NAD(P)-dependent oxidoreductase [Bacteroidia bacterium]|nr:SDR family NAD(P)-dependent oxidoreductase [Bacteroidia bacterium]